MNISSVVFHCEDNPIFHGFPAIILLKLFTFSNKFMGIWIKKIIRTEVNANLSFCNCLFCSINFLFSFAFVWIISFNLSMICFALISSTESWTNLLYVRVEIVVVTVVLQIQNNRIVQTAQTNEKIIMTKFTSNLIDDNFLPLC